jgi:hypothetical protein
MTDPAAYVPEEDFGSLLRSATPRDDAGAETLDRYEWQTMMATVDLLGLYMDTLEDPQRDPDQVSDCGVVCEYHEDWSRVVPGDVQLVSGKHKEPRFGAYTTVSSLLGDGGVYHLFDRWHVLGSVPRCRLVTTAGLNSDAATIAEVCEHFRVNGAEAPLPNQRAETAFSRLASDVATRRAAAGLDPVPELNAAVLPQFLARLMLDCGAPRREHLPTLAPTAYAEPVARALGRSDLAVEIWEAVLSLVRRRMRAAGPARRGLLPSLTPGSEDELERRTITVADAHVAAMVAITTPGGFTPLPQLVITNRMAVKMNEGRCAATSIERAEMLRKRFAAYRRAQRSQPGSREAEIELDLLLRRVADRATAATRNDIQPWGATMWSELETRLGLEAAPGAATRLDTDLLLGGVSDLANNCKVWYSEPFDAKARVAAMREERA